MHFLLPTTPQTDRRMNRKYGRYYYVVKSYGIVVLDRDNPDWREVYNGFDAASKRVYELNGWKKKQ